MGKARRLCLTWGTLVYDEAGVARLGARIALGKVENLDSMMESRRNER
jgi:hypothetical protein